MASGIKSTGLKKGDRIAVLGKNNPEYLYLFGAAAKVGAIMVPINWRLKAEEIRYIISDSYPKLLFVESEFMPLVTPQVSTFNSIRNLFSMGQAEEGFVAFNDLLNDDTIYPQEKFDHIKSTGYLPLVLDERRCASSFPATVSYYWSEYGFECDAGWGHKYHHVQV